MKLLIDECLSEELTKLARERGHPESSHVRWIGKSGAKDWELPPVILEGDWTFVTRKFSRLPWSSRHPRIKG
jgi:predicted nuclease of predicted toxin-antitoxin system